MAEKKESIIWKAYAILLKRKRLKQSPINYLNQRVLSNKKLTKSQMEDERRLLIKMTQRRYSFFDIWGSTIIKAVTFSVTLLLIAFFGVKLINSFEEQIINNTASQNTTSYFADQFPQMSSMITFKVLIPVAIGIAIIAIASKFFVGGGSID